MKENDMTTNTTQDSLKALLRAGKGSDVKEMLGRHADSAAAVYRGIRDDGTLNDPTRRQRILKAYVDRRKLVDRDIADMASKVIRTDRDDASRVFGVAGISGDPASLAISRRDAGDRVAAITSEADLRDLLQRATRTGDEVLARAVAERAMELENAEILHAFIGDRPHLDQPVERLWNAMRAEQDTLGMGMQLANIQPIEASGMTQDVIEREAEADPSADRDDASRVFAPGAA
jgi:hypothetical protein